MYGDNMHNCYAYHSLASKALTRLGEENVLMIGYAIWRINGESPSGIVCHLPDCKIEIAPKNANSLQYHAWLKVGSDLVDFTTHQLRRKSAALDKIDLTNNHVEWCPDFLWENENKMKSFQSVRDGYIAGVYNYQPNKDMYELVVSSFPKVTDNDVQLLINNYETEIRYE